MDGKAPLLQFFGFTQTNSNDEVMQGQPDTFHRAGKR